MNEFTANTSMRLARLEDSDEISALIELSARQLGGKFYDDNTIENALKGAFGVDTQLIKDETYYVICVNETKIIACGGWSFRQTLFGSDSNNLRDPQKLNPQTDAVKIRAFFIHPQYARQGLGKQLLHQCESQAMKAGFNQTQLMSTLSGVDFYQKHGYVGKNHIDHKMNYGSFIKFLPMTKPLY
jgi:GNAT superfamily N-acetyltransferase